MPEFPEERKTKLLSKAGDEKAKDFHRVAKAAIMVLQVSLSAICPIILMLTVGIWLDDKYGNGNNWFALAGILIGIYSAYRGTYYLIKDAFFDKDKKEENNGETPSKLDK